MRFSQRQNQKILILIFCFALVIQVQAQQRQNINNPKKNVVVKKSSSVRHNIYDSQRYLPIGHRVGNLPVGFFTLSASGLNYFYHSGVYYKRSKYDYIVVKAPVGLFIHSLPYGYRTIYVRGNPHYYASGVYYAWDNSHRAYRVIDNPSPSEVPDAPVESYASVQDIFVYPANGQSSEKTSQDRYECYLWSVDQTGFDPSLGTSGNTDSYQRALSACLTGRGYTVK